MDERVAVVTGGLRGLGRAMALGLARAGHRVVAVGHIEGDIAEMEATAGAAGLGGRVWPLVADLRSAGEVIATNYLAADRLSRRVAPDMMARGWGRIVNVTTKLDTMNRLGTHPYGASKAALEMATEVWAKEVVGTGLTINIA
jgi:NAD(P)-dependent dehydrogenase (short-subunit alcohol dehydrogenase family)